MRDHTNKGCELKLVESEKVLGALIRSLRSPNRLQSKQPGYFLIYLKC